MNNNVVSSIAINVTWECPHICMRSLEELKCELKEKENYIAEMLSKASKKISMLL
jgi:hypothetical protein